MRLRLNTLLLCAFLCCLAASSAQGASLATTIVTDTSDYAPGDSVIITGNGFWSGETITMDVMNVYNPGVGDTAPPWEVVAEVDGAFETYWIVPNDAVDQTYEVSAVGQSSGIVATAIFTDANSVVEFSIAPPDSICPGAVIDVCAYLVQKCGGNPDAPLAGRDVLFFINPGNCGADVGQAADDTVTTDANGLACATLTVPTTPGEYSIRVKFLGEDKPGSTDPPNSACDPSAKVKLSAANACETFTVDNGYGSAPTVTGPIDTSVTACGPQEICLPLDIQDADCDILSVVTTPGSYAGTVSSFDQIARLNSLGGSVTQVGGGSPGLTLFEASDFVGPLNTLTGVSVTLPNFIFASTVTDPGPFPTGIGPAQSADQLLGSPTDLTFTLPGAGGPDGGNGDGSVDFSSGNHVSLGFGQDVTTCNGSSVDVFLFTNTAGTGTAEILLRNDGMPVHAVTQSFPSSSAGSGQGGVTLDLIDGFVFDEITVTCTSGQLELDAIGARVAPSPSTTDLCFFADTTGIYDITVTVTDVCGYVGVFSTQVTVELNAPPVADAGADLSYTLCAIEEICFPVSFTDPDNNISLTEKTQGPGTLSASQICFTPGSPGSYTFVIHVVDECGAEDYDTVVVSIDLNAPPVAAIPSNVNDTLCAPTQLCYTFTATDPNSDPLTWSLLSGAGSITTAGEYCFTPTVSGVYDVSVQVADTCGAADTVSLQYTITINTAPVATDPTSPITLSLCDPEEVCYQFAATDAQSDPMTWLKLTGDGTVSTSGQWCFTPTADGSYSVTAQVSDPCGAADTVSLTYNVDINSPPTVAFGADVDSALCVPEEICVGYTVDDPDGLAGLVETMVAGFGAIDTAANEICFTPTTDGTYEFIVSVTDDCGETDQDTVLVTVTFGAAATITCPASPVDVFLCDPDQVCLSVGISPASATVTTTFGTYAAGQLCFNADTAGIYDIRIIADETCGSDTCDIQVNVDIGQEPQIDCPAPSALFACDSGENLCVPVGVMGAGATVTVAPIGTYGGGNVCFDADSSGHYVLTVIATTACGADTCEVVADVTVNSVPVASDPVTPVDTFVCAAGQICSQFAATDGDGHTLTWNKLTGNGTVSNAGLWCFDVTAAGGYAVTAAVTDSCGAADTVALTYNVTVNAKPVVSLGADLNEFQCANEEICVPYAVTDADNNITSLTAIPAGVTVDEINEQLCFTPAGPGVYELILTATDECGASDKDTVLVTVEQNSPPAANAGSDQTIFQCANDQICWPASCSDPDGNLATCELVTGPAGATYNGTNICFTPTGTYNYEFVLKATDDCGADSYDTVAIYYTLNTPPVADAGADINEFQCEPDQICWPVSCSDVDVNLSRCELVSGPGTYDGTNICFTPAASGTFTFVLEAEDACGEIDADTVEVTVTINSDPVCTVPSSQAIFQCVATEVCLPAYATDVDGNLTGCQIVSGPGSLVNGEWCYTPMSSQVVTVVIRCEDDCGAFCEKQFSIEFQINRTPEIAFAHLGPQFLCASEEVCVDYTVSDPDDPAPRTVTLVSGPGTLDTLNSQVCFTPATSGTYEFIIRVEDECGAFDQDTTEVEVDINSAPNADAGADDSYNLCQIQEICWPASCSDPDANLTQCNFTGPGTYNGSQICFTPATSGSFEFTLHAVDACGAESFDTVTIDVTVNIDPVLTLPADFTELQCGAEEICVDYTVADGNGLAGIIETMVEGFGTIDTAANQVCFTPTGNGDYRIIVSATDPCGAVSADTITITVELGQQASISCPTSPIDVLLCDPGQVCQTIAVSPLDATIAVSFGTYSNGELCFQADTAGTYQIRMIASTACGADTCDMTFTVDIGQAPDITCPAPGSVFACDAGEQVCVAVGVMGDGATVTLPGFATYSGGNVCFNADTAGQYEIEMIAETACGADTCLIEVDVTLNSPPVAVDPATPVDTFICASAQICYQFEASDIDGQDLTWARISGNGTVNAAGLWCFDANGSGSYTVVAQVTDECDATDDVTLTYNITLNSAPLVDLGQNQTAFQCASEEICVPYIVTDADDNIASLVASVGTISEIDGTICFTADTAGVYTVALEATDDCGATDADTITVTVEFNQPPVANAGDDASLFFCSQSQMCWAAGCSDPDGNLSTCAITVGGGVAVYDGSTICFTPDDTAGVYTIVLRAEDACGEFDEDTIAITVTLNGPPTVTAPNDTSFLLPGPQLLSLPYTTFDPDDNLDFCELVRGSGSLVSGNWEFTPSADQSFWVVIRCVDECGEQDVDSFLVTIDINDPPQVDLGDDIFIFACNATQVCVDVAASDPNNNLDSVWVIQGSGTYNDGTGQYCVGFSGPNDASHTAIIAAVDLFGLESRDTVVIEVDFNSPPVVDLPADFTAYLEEPGEVCFDAGISDDDGNITNVSVDPIGIYDAGTGQICFTADSSGIYCFEVTATDGCGAVSTDSVCIEVVVDECIHVQIENVDGVIQGNYETVGIWLNGSGKPVGGFDFLISYDPSALVFIEAEIGDLLVSCGWEYLTYRTGPFGNCGTGCPTGLVRISALAETNNGAYHPGCYLEGLFGKMVNLKFLVSNDRALECQFTPISFFWIDCGDNSFSDIRGDTLWVVRTLYDWRSENITDNTQPLPSAFGLPQYCLTPDEPGKPTGHRCVDLTNGGLRIICGNEIDDRGDLNLNLVAYEIADAVIFANYFIYGLPAFHILAADPFDPESVNLAVAAATAASDVNADGIPLSVADLVYLIRVVVGDAFAIPKPNPNSDAFAQVTFDGRNLTVSETSARIGALAMVFSGEVEPVLTEAAQGMDMEFRYDGEVTRVLVFNDEADKSLAAGQILTLSRQSSLESIQIGSHEGMAMEARLLNLPTEYALSQNYPNPFNPTTTIEFALPIAGKWSLTVYNVLGQTVERFAGEDEPGYYTVEWDAEAFASGVYFYRLTSRDYTSSRKMILLK